MSPLVDMVRILGDTEEVHHILNRKFLHHHLLSDTMSEIVKELKQIVPTTPTNISIQLFSRETIIRDGKNRVIYIIGYIVTSFYTLERWVFK